MAQTISINPPPTITSFFRGQKFFELSNHLGNVMVIVSDRKLQVQVGVGHYFTADLQKVKDYYAFGMTMPEREIGTGTYRYGFNGKEEDSEISSAGNQYDFGFRIYNAGLGRFLSSDPLSSAMPSLSPYQYAANTPIQAIDRDGLSPTGRILFYDPNSETALLLNLPQALMERDNRSRIVLISSENLEKINEYNTGTIDPSGKPIHITDHEGMNQFIMTQLRNQENFVMDASDQRGGYGDNILEYINRVISSSAANDRSNVNTLGGLRNVDESSSRTGRILAGRGSAALYDRATSIGGVVAHEKIPGAALSGVDLDFSDISSPMSPLGTESTALRIRLGRRRAQWLSSGLWRTAKEGSDMRFSAAEINSGAFNNVLVEGMSIISSMGNGGAHYIFSNSNFNRLGLAADAILPTFIIDRHEADFLTPLLDSKDGTRYQGTIQFSRNTKGGTEINGEIYRPRD